MTSLMRQRALAKKLAKMSSETDSKKAGGSTSQNPSKESDAKTRAKERLLKQRQEELEKMEATNQQEQERIQKEKQDAEIAKLRGAAVEGGVGLLAHVLQKMQTKAITHGIECWVENFGEDLALQELEEEDRLAEEEAEAQAAAEEAAEAQAAAEEEAAAAEVAAAEEAAWAEVVAEEAASEEAAEEEEVGRDRAGTIELDSMLGEIEGAIAAAQDGAAEETAVCGGDSVELAAEVARIRKLLEAKASEMRSLNDDLLSSNQEVLSLKKANVKLEETLADTTVQFKASKQELAATHRSIIEERMSAAVEPAAKPDAVTEKRIANLKEGNKELQEELSMSQRMVIKLRGDLEEAGDDKGGKSGGGDNKKMKAALAGTNKELSAAQFKVLSMREAFREVLQFATDMDEFEQDEDNQEKISEIIERSQSALDDAG